MLAFGLIGMIGAAVMLMRGSVTLNRRAALLALVLSALLPVGLAILSHPAFYNGLRHFVFLVPPFAVAGGLAFGWLFARARPYGKATVAALWAILLAGVSLPVYNMARLHPY